MNDNIAEIKRRLNIIDVVGEYVVLKKMGSNSRALCPFHQEKSPSFMVSEDKQIWHCFGCGEGGDIFVFIQKIEGVEFVEALRMLATKAHVTLGQMDPQLATKKTRVLDLLEQAARFFQRELLSGAGASGAREYAHRRGLKKETLEDFQIGYAPASWEAVRHFLLSKKFSDAEIAEAGLTVRSDRGRGYYDRFRDRLMFPIHDVGGHVVGFGGRALSEKDGGAKYINSPETPVYHKGSVVFNLHRTKQLIRSEQSVILMEGYMDVITTYQAGVRNVVAVSGTALTPEQVKLLGRYTKKILFAFDMDAAGQQASVRGLLSALPEDMNVFAVVLPFGKDPDECIRKDPQAFLEAVKNAPPFMDYFLQSNVKKFDLSTALGKKSFVGSVLSVIAQLPDPVEMNHYVHQLADQVNIQPQMLLDKVSKARNRRMQNIPKARSPLAVPASAAPSRQAVSVEKLLNLLVSHPQYLSLVMEGIDPENIEDAFLRELYKRCIIYYTHHQDFSWKDLEFSLGDWTQDKRFTRIFFDVSDAAKADRDPVEVKEEIRKILSSLEKEVILRHVHDLEHEMKVAEKAGDSAQFDILSEAFIQYTQRLQKF